MPRPRKSAKATAKVETVKVPPDTSWTEKPVEVKETKNLKPETQENSGNVNFGECTDTVSSTLPCEEECPAKPTTTVKVSESSKNMLTEKVRHPREVKRRKEDTQSVLEKRIKRFRMENVSNSNTFAAPATTVETKKVSEDDEKLRKRAERFKVNYTSPVHSRSVKTAIDNLGDELLGSFVVTLVWKHFLIEMKLFTNESFSALSWALFSVAFLLIAAITLFALLYLIQHTEKKVEDKKLASTKRKLQNDSKPLEEIVQSISGPITNQPTILTSSNDSAKEKAREVIKNALQTVV
ncbi:DNA translocase FtsK [Trichinella spiralis]|uniref:DNA translocase FtsK n=1 Tax=Trichinella spiralis TaxID=6334 RepID=A0ABR3K574_TRISP